MSGQRRREGLVRKPTVSQQVRRRHNVRHGKLLGYFLLLDDGSQTMLTPAEFEQRFGWKNDPSKVPQLPGME